MDSETWLFLGVIYQSTGGKEFASKVALTVSKLSLEACSILCEKLQIHSIGNTSERVDFANRLRIAKLRSIGLSLKSS
ncbi:MAG: hypothetical protein ACAF41_26985 [Leptolyngbya sp. BL-A-14]